MKKLGFIEVVGNCENFQELPEIKFFINNDIYSLDPKDYLISISENGIKGLYDHPKNEDRVQCFAAFSVLDFEENNIFILGDIFLTKYYSIYNLKEKKIGLAKAA